MMFEIAKKPLEFLCGSSSWRRPLNKMCALHFKTELVCVSGERKGSFQGRNSSHCLSGQRDKGRPFAI